MECCVTCSSASRADVPGGNAGRMSARQTKFIGRIENLYAALKERSPSWIRSGLFIVDKDVSWFRCCLRALIGMKQPSKRSIWLVFLFLQNDKQQNVKRRFISICIFRNRTKLRPYGDQLKANDFRSGREKQI